MMGLPRWALAVHARSLRLAAPPLVAGWAAGRGSCGRCACSPSSLAQGIPRAAMSPAASGGCTVEPVAEETSDAQRDLLDERLT